MSTYTNAKWPADNKQGGVQLASYSTDSPFTGTDTAETAVYLGKGKYRIVTTWSTCAVDGGDEFYHMTLEANTRNDTSTYYEIATLAVLGDSSVTGRNDDDAATGAKEIIVDNPYDYQVRVHTFSNGSTVSCAFTVYAYPLNRKA